MRAKYETLDDYLDDLDAVKEKIAEETQGMTPKQVKAYFARASRELDKATASEGRGRLGGRKGSPLRARQRRARPSNAPKGERHANHQP